MLMGELYAFPVSRDAKRFHDIALTAKLTGVKYGFYIETTNCPSATFHVDSP